MGAISAFLARVMRLEADQFEALFAGLDRRRTQPLETASPAAAECLTGAFARAILPLFYYGTGHECS